jgi:hypothetical protein
MGSPAIWREKRLLLIALGILLAANTVFFFTYRVQYENRLEALDDRLAASKARLAQGQAARVAAERRYAMYQRIETDVQEVYNRHWSTQAERLAPLIIEIKRLAVASQLVPKTYSFSQIEAVNDNKLGIRAGGTGARAVGISYTVSGTYEQARRLINLLELSQQFVIVNSVTLSSSADKDLTLNLQLKTLFRDDKPQTRAAGQPL